MHSLRASASPRETLEGEKTKKGSTQRVPGGVKGLFARRYAQEASLRCIVDGINTPAGCARRPGRRGRLAVTT